MDSPQPNVVFQRPRSQKGLVEATVEAGKKVKEVGSTILMGAVNWWTGVETQEAPVSNPDLIKITCAKFVDIELFPPKKTPCLIYGSNKGFEVWDISQAAKDPARPEGKERVIEVLCQVDYLPTQIYALPRTRSENSPYIGFVTATEPETLYLKSLSKLKSFFAVQPLGEPIVNVLSNDDVVVVVGSTQCVLLDPISFRVRYRIPIYQGIRNFDQEVDTIGCVALGPRFLAFQSHSGSRRRKSNGHSSSLGGSGLQGGLLQSAVGVGKTARSYAYGTEAVQSPPGGGEITIIDLSETAREVHPPPETESFPDSILIDAYEAAEDDDKPSVYLNTPIENHFRIISRFSVEGGAISTMTFDPSGSLLAIANENGIGLSIYQMDCTQEYSHQKSRPRLLHHLSRGVTQALIKHISFSPDLAIVECVSNHRTTHTWAPRADIFEHNHCNLNSTTPTEKMKALYSLSKAPFTSFGGVNKILPRDQSYYKILNFDDSGILSLNMMKVVMNTDPQNKITYTWEIIPASSEWSLLSVDGTENHRKRENYQFRQDKNDLSHSLGPAPFLGNTHWFGEVEYQTCTLPKADLPAWKNPAYNVKMCRGKQEPPKADGIIPIQETVYSKIDWEDVNKTKTQQNKDAEDFSVSKLVFNEK